MDEKVQNIIVERFTSLPGRIQEVILSDFYQETLEEVGKQYQLNLEQLGILERETTLVMMGLTPVIEFEAELTRELNVNKQKVSQIIETVNEKIFSGVRDLLEIMSPSINEDSGTIKAEKNNPKPQNKSVGSSEGELDERFSGLSDGIKQIIIKSGYYTKLYAIAETNKLTVPQMGTLEEVTTGVVTDTIHPEEFEKRLIKNLGLPEGIVRKIINEINTTILKPIREQMEKVYNQPETNAYEIKPQINKGETVQSGIRIIRPVSENVEPILDTMELKEGDLAIDKEMNPVLGQKLASSYKATTVKTDHSLNNLQSSAAPKKEIPKAYPPKGDPYREIPE